MAIKMERCPRTTMFYFVPEVGTLPKELRGKFTHREVAEKALLEVSARQAASAKKPAQKRKEAQKKAQAYLNNEEPPKADPVNAEYVDSTVPEEEPKVATVSNG